MGDYLDITVQPVENIQEDQVKVLAHPSQLIRLKRMFQLLQKQLREIEDENV